MNVSQIETALEEYEWSEFYSSRKRYDVPGLPPVKLVENVGGEGEGDHRHLVFLIDGKYYKKTGYYASYEGTSWDGYFAEVEPVEKTVTVYE